MLSRSVYLCQYSISYSVDSSSSSRSSSLTHDIVIPPTTTTTLLRHYPTCYPSHISYTSFAGAFVSFFAGFRTSIAGIGVFIYTYNKPAVRSAAVRVVRLKLYSTLYTNRPASRHRCPCPRDCGSLTSGNELRRHDDHRVRCKVPFLILGLPENIDIFNRHNHNRHYIHIDARNSSTFVVDLQ